MEIPTWTAYLPNSHNYYICFYWYLHDIDNNQQCYYVINAVQMNLFHSDQYVGSEFDGPGPLLVMGKEVDGQITSKIRFTSLQVSFSTEIGIKFLLWKRPI